MPLRLLITTVKYIYPLLEHNQKAPSNSGEHSNLFPFLIVEPSL